MLDTLRSDFRRNRDPLARLVLTVFRFGQWTAGPTATRKMCAIPYKVANLLVLRLGTNSDLHRNATVGPGLRLPHPYGLIIHKAAVIGAHVTMYQRVTVGRKDLTGEPAIGDRVVLGANSTVLGPITIGDGAKIGAGAMVLDDVPAGGVAVGPRAVIREANTNRPGSASH